jgi:NAD(P)-dependent dehydrogenase (short-subunit alcohol dehydrogenase family)
MDELSQAMELNFFGVARVTKAVLPAMRAARTGRVITVTSLNGVVDLPFSDAYNAAKFAVEGLMESLATVMPRVRGVHLGAGTGSGANCFLRQCRWARRQHERRRAVRKLINRFNRRMAALGSSGQSAESVADVICEIAADPSPALPYQSSEESRAIAAQKLVDPTGRSILAGTGDFFIPHESTLLRADPASWSAPLSQAW